MEDLLKDWDAQVYREVKHFRDRGEGIANAKRMAIKKVVLNILPKINEDTPKSHISFIIEKVLTELL